MQAVTSALTLIDAPVKKSHKPKKSRGEFERRCSAEDRHLFESETAKYRQYIIKLCELTEEVLGPRNGEHE